jgi:hypothetical protein
MTIENVGRAAVITMIVTNRASEYLRRVSDEQQSGIESRRANPGVGAYWEYMRPELQPLSTLFEMYFSLHFSASAVMMHWDP